MNEIKLGKKINEGGYGKIYISYTDDKKIVKECNKCNLGINNLIEISIMNIYEHDYINTCTDFIATKNYIYIYQNRAITDVYNYLKKYNVNKNKIKEWCYSISLAIKFLHDQNIIHADIKTDNFLVFNDLSVKLTDFTFSVIKWHNNDKFCKNVCTAIYKPLEIIKGEYWDESIDIWALGCAFYEMYYGHLLFSEQEDSDRNDRQRYNNALLDWAFDGPNSEYIESEYYSIDWKSYNLDPDFYNPENTIFNNLILKMLMVNPKERININQVLDHEYFTGINIKINTPNIKKLKLKNLGDSKQKIKRLFNLECKNLNNSKLIEKIAINIYRSFIYHLDSNYYTNNEKKLIKFSIWFASKIVNMKPVQCDELNDMLDLEIRYCNLTNCMFMSII